MTPDLYHPVLDCFMRGLPHAYRKIDAPIDTTLQVKVTGECGGDWFLVRSSASWNLVKKPYGKIASQVTMSQELAWRLFTKGIDHDSALPTIQIDGDRDLGAHTLNLTPIVA
jgi:hypothetical protein